jgi:hypothetical protein
MLILEGLLRAFEAFPFRHGTGRLRARLRHRLMVLWTNRMHGFVGHYPIRCDAALLEEVLALGNRFYEGSTGLEAREIRDRHLRNPQITTAIVACNRKTGLRSVVGFYVLLPLTERGTEALQAGRAKELMEQLQTVDGAEVDERRSVANDDHGWPRSRRVLGESSRLRQGQPVLFEEQTAISWHNSSSDMRAA